MLSQKSAPLPNTRAGISEVGAVTLRRSLHSSLTCLRCTPVPSANATGVRPIGAMNSSIRISPHAGRLAFGRQHGSPHRVVARMRASGIRARSLRSSFEACSFSECVIDLRLPTRALGLEVVENVGTEAKQYQL